MFVTNCKVITAEVLRFPKGGKLKKKKKNAKSESSSSASTTGDVDIGNQTAAEPNNSADDEKYNPVKCEQCNTEVGVLDKDEVYHFFNVLASYS